MPSKMLEKDRHRPLQQRLTTIRVAMVFIEKKIGDKNQF